MFGLIIHCKNKLIYENTKKPVTVNDKILPEVVSHHENEKSNQHENIVNSVPFLHLSVGQEHHRMHTASEFLTDATLVFSPLRPM